MCNILFIKKMRSAPIAHVLKDRKNEIFVHIIIMRAVAVFFVTASPPWQVYPLERIVNFNSCNVAIQPCKNFALLQTKYLLCNLNKFLEPY